MPNDPTSSFNSFMLRTQDGRTHSHGQTELFFIQHSSFFRSEKCACEIFQCPMIPPVRSIHSCCERRMGEPIRTVKLNCSSFSIHPSSDLKNVPVKFFNAQ